jgi:hypothetical protein
LPSDLAKKLVLKLRSTQTGKPEHSIELSGTDRSWAKPTFSPDGKLLAVYSGETTEVFDTATGNRVFEHETAGPQFLADGTLLMVWGRSVQRWNTANWEPGPAHTLDLGREPNARNQNANVPRELPNPPRLVLFESYPSHYPELLRSLTRTLRINAYGSNHMTLVNIADGSRQPIELHLDQLVSAVAYSPTGDRIALGYWEGDVEIWTIPPPRSYRAPYSAAALVLVSLVLLYALRKRKRVASEAPDSPPANREESVGT